MVGKLDHLKSHSYCIIGALFVGVLASYMTAAVLAVSGDNRGQIARGESVYIYAPFYAGGYGADLSVKQGEANDTAQDRCGVSFLYKAEWTGNQGIKAAEPQSGLSIILLSKQLPTGTRLGNFEPPISCAGSYIYRAEVLN